MVVIKGKDFEREEEGQTALLSLPPGARERDSVFPRPSDFFTRARVYELPRSHSVCRFARTRQWLRRNANRCASSPFEGEGIELPGLNTLSHKGERRMRATSAGTGQ